MDKDFEYYIREGEPSAREKAAAWAIGIGLQDVDQLKTSQYLKEAAKRNIEGSLSISEVKSLLCSYYEEAHDRLERSAAEEADIVSANIAEILAEKAFVFSPMGLVSLHGRIFNGVFNHAGKIRDCNFTKKEWVLDGDTVLYASASELIPTLEYDIGNEKGFQYSGLAKDAFLDHVARFASNLWQIHPFREGNTRTTAVFVIKRLKMLGLNVENRPFADNSWYFRNALVRANYANAPKGISETREFLIRFFDNALMGGRHELKNRHLHISFLPESP